MVLFKINGERNSGTRFLLSILNNNGFPLYNEHNEENKIVYHWKHGIPSDDYKKLDEKVVDLFIFRNINDWLMSTHKNNYHLKDIKLFEDFLKCPQISSEEFFLDYRTNRCLNEDDNNKTIFQIREYKFNKIMEYKKINKDVILINLSFIQNEKNLSQFLDFLSEKYMPNLKVNNYILSINHTKDNSKDKNRNYDTNIDEYKDIIDSNKNVKIENFINNLTFIYN
jgi:hypothetical protein